MKAEVVIFDIDGTLADVTHRRHFVEGKKKDFDKFYDAMPRDMVNKDVRELNHMCAQRGHKIIICTGRPEQYRELTEEWLEDENISFQELRMRPDNLRFKPDYEVKQTMLDDIKKDHNVVFAVDDRNQVVEMWRKNGITCLQVNEGDF